MYTYRRVQRALALTCTAVALGAVPATAAAMPAADPAGAKSSSTAPIVVREVQTGGGGQTLALVVSGTALLVALGGAGYAGRRVQQGQPSH
jgi:hypothetical protein